MPFRALLPVCNTVAVAKADDDGQESQFLALSSIAGKYSFSETGNIRGLPRIKSTNKNNQVNTSVRLPQWKPAACRVTQTRRLAPKKMQSVRHPQPLPPSKPHPDDPIGQGTEMNTELIFHLHSHIILIPLIKISLFLSPSPPPLPPVMGRR